MGQADMDMGHYRLLNDMDIDGSTRCGYMCMAKVHLEIYLVCSAL